MTIILRPEQEQLLREAISSGLAQGTEEALDHALDTLRYQSLFGASLFQDLSLAVLVESQKLSRADRKSRAIQVTNTSK